MKGSVAGAERLLLAPYGWADPVVLEVSMLGKDAVEKIELFPCHSARVTMQTSGILE